jgi:hypothetical protein
VDTSIRRGGSVKANVSGARVVIVTVVENMLAETSGINARIDGAQDTVGAVGGNVIGVSGGGVAVRREASVQLC